MQRALASEVAELRRQHQGLTRLRETDAGCVLSGSLPFEASAEGHETIADIFEIDLIVPGSYPKALPWVLETGGRISSDYEHVYEDGKLCLAVPIEERLTFERLPSLLGFVNNLLIPYCYGYCYWERHGVHPFGEREHGRAGIVRFYIDWLDLPGEVEALKVALDLVQHRYRGHHDCPCGSGAKLRNCHRPALMQLDRHHTAATALHDFGAVLAHCVQKAKAGELQLPAELARRIRRYLEKPNSSARRDNASKKEPA